MVLAVAIIDIPIGVLLLQIEESAVVFRLAAYEILKRLVSYLCYKTKSSLKLKQIAYFECIH